MMKYRTVVDARNGYTLITMLSVISIIGVVLGISARYISLGLQVSKRHDYEARVSHHLSAFSRQFRSDVHRCSVEDWGAINTEGEIRLKVRGSEPSVEVKYQKDGQSLLRLELDAQGKVLQQERYFAGETFRWEKLADRNLLLCEVRREGSVSPQTVVAEIGKLVPVAQENSALQVLPAEEEVR